MDEEKQIQLLKILYAITNNQAYIDYLINISSQNVGAYSLLTILYQDEKIPKVYEALMDIMRNATQKKEMYQKMSKRLSLPENSEEELITRFNDDSIKHDQELYDMLTDKKMGINRKVKK